mgnify:CR=1 FL=1
MNLPQLQKIKVFKDQNLGTKYFLVTKYFCCEKCCHYIFSNKNWILVMNYYLFGTKFFMSKINYFETKLFCS